MSSCSVACRHGLSLLPNPVSCLRCTPRSYPPKAVLGPRDARSLSPVPGPPVSPVLTSPHPHQASHSGPSLHAAPSLPEATLSCVPSME